jgi:hypothetical protein
MELGDKHSQNLKKRETLHLASMGRITNTAKIAVLFQGSFVVQQKSYME